MRLENYAVAFLLGFVVLLSGLSPLFFDSDVSCSAEECRCEQIEDGWTRDVWLCGRTKEQ